MRKITVRLDFNAALQGLVFLFEGDLLYPQRLHRHRELEANIVVSGRATYVIENQKINVAYGNLLWLFPDQHHTLLTKSPDFKLWVINWRPQWVRMLTEAPARHWLRETHHERIQLSNLPLQGVERFHERLLELQAHTADFDSYNLRLGQLLHDLDAAHRLSSHSAETHVLHPAVAKAIRQLKESNEESLTFPTLLAGTGLSYSQLSRVFKHDTGLTLGEFREQVRLQRAMLLWKSARQQSLLYCVLSAGFGSYSQFHRVFRKHFPDATPRAYFARLRESSSTFLQ